MEYTPGMEFPVRLFYLDGEDDSEQGQVKLSVPVIPVHRMLDQPVPDNTDTFRTSSYLFDDLGRLLLTGKTMLGLYSSIHQSYAMYKAHRATYAGVIYGMSKAEKLASRTIAWSKLGLEYDDYAMDADCQTLAPCAYDLACQREKHHVALFLECIIGQGLITHEHKDFCCVGLHREYVEWCRKVDEPIALTGLNAFIVTPANFLRHLDLAHGLTPRIINHGANDKGKVPALYSAHEYHYKHLGTSVVDINLSNLKGI